MASNNATAATIINSTAVLYPSAASFCVSSLDGGYCYDTGNTAWMLLSAALVLLMTPGLALFYGGLVSRKTVLVIILQNFWSLAFTSLLWYVIAYSLVFSGDRNGILGDANRAFFMNANGNSVSAFSSTIPESVFFVYQMMFAVITPALITGAFAGRVRFPAYCIFLFFWLMIVYVPWAHWIWGGGFLNKWGVLDFAGGIVVHTTAGFAALASAIYVGPRHKKTHAPPHNIPMVATGTGLLWFGWFGFNAGSALGVAGITGIAFLNTQLGGATAGFVWMCVEWIHTGKPKLSGLLVGCVAGLATITPACGYVDTWAAVVIGGVGALVCYGLILLLHSKTPLDDALDVFGCHGMGGVTGSILLGCLGNQSINPNGAWGLFYKGGYFFAKQVVATICAALYAFGFTFGMLFLIDKFLPGGLHVDVEAEEDLDKFELAEGAYEHEHHKRKKPEGKQSV